MFEENLTGYENLMYFDGNEKIESPIYKINVEKATIISKNNRIRKPSLSQQSGYYNISLHRKRKQFHTLLWEHANGLVPKDKVIDHIDDNKLNNVISNLQIVTPSENVQKTWKHRDKAFLKHNHANKHKVKAVNIATGEITEHKSLYNVHKVLKVNAGIVKMCCEGINNCKTGKSKLNNQKYSFSYIN